MARTSVPRSRAIASSAALALALVLGWWSAHVTLRPAAPDPTEAAPASYRVVQGKLERSLTFSAKASWPRKSTVRGGSSGTVTSVELHPGQEVKAGDLLFRVDERPVIVAAGAVPAYRAISVGAVGRDVAQLEQFLAAAGYLAAEPNDRFEGATVFAVRSLQNDLGITPDGTVALGDVVFLPRLPARVNLSDGVSVGASLSAGSEVVTILAERPLFTITLAEDQADLVPLDGEVSIDHNRGTWPARVASVRALDGEMEFTLASVSKEAICRSGCEDAVPLVGEALFRAHLIVVAPTSGPLVPASALLAEPSGSTYVVRVDGEHVPVTIVAADGGRSIVDGVEVGTELRLFAETS